MTMPFYVSASFSFLTTFLFFSSSLFSSSQGQPALVPTFQDPPPAATTPPPPPPTSGDASDGENAEPPGGQPPPNWPLNSPPNSPLDSPLVLAQQRTYRKDPLDGFKRYTGGWNISDRHYWASVGYTTAPFFVLAAVWFLVVGLSLTLICVCYFCCKRKVPYGYSQAAYVISIVFLVLLAITAAIGCLILYKGQGKFHDVTTETLDYVENQADTTVDKLKEVSDFVAQAKLIAVDNVSLPSSVQTDLNQIENELNSAATMLQVRSSDSSKDIRAHLDSVRLALIMLSATVLTLAFLGLLFSILGKQLVVCILVVIGWILITGMFVLCGVFLLLHNVASDTCVAMDEWVQNPTAHTALDDILPCVDKSTALDTLSRSKEITYQFVEVINSVITNVSNINFSPNFPSVYFNQSGPLLPILCNPFHPNLTNRSCSAGEVDLSKATQEWMNYVCQVSASGICITTGRLTPNIYGQMAASVNVSNGLSQYGPFLIELEDCTLVKQTFSDISRDYCPGLRRYSWFIYVGLVTLSAAVMLSLVFWAIFGRERRHWLYTKQALSKKARSRDRIEENKWT
ncbi:hypothetical protein NMG60_11028081 [Bertholletia excelsa]